MMKSILGVHFKWFWLFFAIGAALTFAIGRYIEFHALSNDYWNILYYGRRMSLSEPESLYNGFFPFGYPFLIGRMPFTYVLPLSYLLNALLTGLFTASVSTLILSSGSIPATLLAFFSSIAAPFVFQNANTLSPDIGAAAFTAFAVFLLWNPLAGKGQADADNSALRFALAGISLGLSFLWRTHAAASILGVLAGWFLLFGFRPYRPRVILLGSLAVVAGVQVIVNLVSGHGMLETAQDLNLYKFFYGVDWTYPPEPEEIAQFSLVKTITEDPIRAFELYIPFFQYYISHIWAAGLAFLLSPKGHFARFSAFSLIFIVLYAIPISLSDSARAPVILHGIYLSSVAILLAVLIDLAQKHLGAKYWLQWAVFALFITMGSKIYYGWVAYDIGIVRAAHAERGIFTSVEYTLRANGMTSPTEIFSDRYDFYTPNTMPYRSRQIGNWSAGWVWGFNEEFPPIPNDSWEAFSAACREQGVRYLVLGPNSHARGDIFQPIYNGDMELDEVGLRFIAQRGNFRLYTFK